MSDLEIVVIVDEHDVDDAAKEIENHLAEIGILATVNAP